ncbi:formyltransferase family protein [Hoeflea sp. AS16]|uniref:formyltransferase family protein n=1 Tax=Hoeflea sp. AS16 TaxID=3135779 RepID=UPI003177D004
MTPIRRVLAVAHDNSGSRLLFENVSKAFPEIEFGLAITEGLYYRKTALQSVMKLVRESSIIFCAVRAFDLFLYKMGRDTLANKVKRDGLFSFRTRDINDVQSVASAREFAPDLILSLYTMHIYRAEFIAIAPLGGIGTHPSIFPDYRGLEVFFWAMVNNEPTIGVSVFKTEVKVDSGKVLNEAVLPLDPKQPMNSVYRMITEKAADLLIKSIREIGSDSVTYRIPEGEGRYFPMPTREAVWKFIRLGKRFF